METLLKDIRYGVRGLLKRPGFSLVAITTLALGIGANTAIFSVVRAVLLRPLPFPQSEQLVMINDQNGKTGETVPTVAPGDFFDWKKENESFLNMGAYSGWSVTLMEGDQPEVIPATRVTDGFFPTLQIQPLLGRIFVPDEFTGNSKVMVLSYRLWQRRFGSDPAIVGKSFAVENGSIMVVGVMPPEFKLPATAETWTPVAQNSSEMGLRASRYFEAVARLKPNVTQAGAEAELRTMAARQASQYPASNSNWSVRLKTLRESLVGDVRRVLLVLFGSVAMLLLIACGNVANLLLARATTRYREIAIRAALGASRWRILRQLIAESLLLSGLGCALGILLGYWCISAILWLIPKDLRFPRIEEAQLDPMVLGFSVAVALLAGVIIGLIPGLKASRPNLKDSLNESSPSAGKGGRSQYLRSVLVVTEIALTLVLLAGAGLLIRSLIKLQHVELGFNEDKLLVVPVSASMVKYAEPQSRAAFFERIAQEIQTVPGVQSVATASTPPQMHTMYFPFAIAGRTNPNEVPQAWFNSVSPAFFRVMGISVAFGREFTEHDRAGSQNVVIINETLQRRYFAQEDPIGKNLTVNYLNTPLTLQVIGVVKDIKQESLHAPVNAQIYVSSLQLPWFSTALIVRTQNDPATVITAVQRAIRSVDPTQSGSAAKTMTDLLSDSVAQPRFYSLFLGFFAALALILATIGVYGVVSYAVAQRMHEFGIRMALGAQVVDVLKLVIVNGMLLVLTGSVIGLGAAFVLTRLLKEFLFGVTASDPWTFAATVLLLAGVAAVACYIPARRATKVDPLVALRYE